MILTQNNTLSAIMRAVRLLLLTKARVHYATTPQYCLQLSQIIDALQLQVSEGV